MNGQYDEAMKLYKESLQIQTEVGIENNRALALNKIGSAFLQKGDYEDAQTCFAQSLAIREKLKVPTDIADTLSNLAETSMKTAQYNQALAQYNESARTQAKCGRHSGRGPGIFRVGHALRLSRQVWRGPQFRSGGCEDAPG